MVAVRHGKTLEHCQIDCEVAALTSGAGAQVREFEVDEVRQAAEDSSGAALVTALAERKRTLELWSTTAYSEVGAYCFTASAFMWRT